MLRNSAVIPLVIVLFGVDDRSECCAAAEPIGTSDVRRCCLKGTNAIE